MKQKGYPSPPPFLHFYKQKETFWDVDFLLIPPFLGLRRPYSPTLKIRKSSNKVHKYIYISSVIIVQLISYKRFLECMLILWRLSIYP